MNDSILLNLTSNCEYGFELAGDCFITGANFSSFMEPSLIAVIELHVEALRMQCLQFGDPEIFSLFQYFPHRCYWLVLLFQFFNDRYLCIPVEVVSMLVEVLTHMDRIIPEYVVSVLVESDIHRPFAFPNILFLTD